MNTQGTQPDGQPPRGGGWFTTTHWSVVLQAREDDPRRAAEALSVLCESYWGPVNAYIRHLNHEPSNADDLTQQFFARFLENAHYRLADRRRGRFRTFLLSSVKHFLVNEWKRNAALKRGGGAAHISLDEPDLEGERSRLQLLDERNAELIYERNWALAALGRVRERLARAYADQGLGERFARLEHFLPGEQAPTTYADVAAQFHVAEGTIKSDVHRLKRRYREFLREEIANTVAAPAEVDEELRHLVKVLSG